MDDKTKRGPADRSRINMHEDYEVAYWTKLFGVTRQQLQNAVNAVGNSAEKVAQYLASRR